VIVTQNPLDDIKVLYGTGAERVSPDGNVNHIAGVMYTVCRGVVFDAQAMLRDVENMVKQAKQKAAHAGS
jgi:hypothetical protein